MGSRVLCITDDIFCTTIRSLLFNLQIFYQMITPINVAPAIKAAMDEQTTWCPDDYRCKEWGQCGNVAALLNWWFGLDIVEETVSSEGGYKEPHYSNNRTQDGTSFPIDYTFVQFKCLPHPAKFSAPRIITYEQLINERWKQSKFARYRRAFVYELGKIIDTIKS